MSSQPTTAGSSASAAYFIYVRRGSSGQTLHYLPTIARSLNHLLFPSTSKSHLFCLFAIHSNAVNRCDHVVIHHRTSGRDHNDDDNDDRKPGHDAAQEEKEDSCDGRG